MGCGNSRAVAIEEKDETTVALELVQYGIDDTVLSLSRDYRE